MPENTPENMPGRPAAHAAQPPRRVELPCGCCIPVPDPVAEAAERASFPEEGPWPRVERDPVVSRAAEKHIGDALFGPLQGVVHETRSWLVYVEIHLRGPLAGDDPRLVDLHTAGMSQRPMNHPENRRHGLPLHAELTMQFPEEWCAGESLLRAVGRPGRSWPVLWLRTLARIPHERRSFLDCGHVVVFPENAYEGCRFDGALITDVVIDEFSSVGAFVREDMAAVQLFQVIPLLPPETDYARRHCGNHLIEKLEAAGLGATVHVDRDPVV